MKLWINNSVMSANILFNMWHYETWISFAREYCFHLRITSFIYWNNLTIFLQWIPPIQSFLIWFLMKYQCNKWIVNSCLYKWHHSYQNHDRLPISYQKRRKINLLWNHKLLCDCVWHCRLFWNFTKHRSMQLNEKL